MTDKQQPEALRLAELLTADEWPGHMTLVSYARECVAELRRQHAELETLRAGYDAARLEIESLQRRVQEVGAAARREHGLAAAPTTQPAPQQEDAARLDWLLWKLPGDAIRYVVGELADTADAAEFRAAIDAARKQGANHD